VGLPALGLSIVIAQVFEGIDQQRQVGVLKQTVESQSNQLAIVIARNEPRTIGPSKASKLAHEL
jgi:hypothetical protein